METGLTASGSIWVSIHELLPLGDSEGLSRRLPCPIIAFVKGGDGQGNSAGGRKRLGSFRVDEVEVPRPQGGANPSIEGENRGFGGCLQGGHALVFPS